MSEFAISVQGVSKAYRIWQSPAARLVAPLMNGVARLVPPFRGFLKQKATAQYRDFWALKKVSFEIKKGESAGIIGRNGSGKSTLLQIIAGTLRPTEGSISVRGRVAALLELGSGFNPDFTGRENVYLNGAVLGLSREEIDAKFKAITTFADIGDFIEQPVKTYSSGMMIRLAFAVQIQLEPDILIVDEALSVGDEPFQRKCYQQISLMQERGVTILFVSHSSATITELCQKVVLLDHGRCLLTSSPKIAVQAYNQLCYAPADQIENVRADILKLGSNLSESTESTPPTTSSIKQAPSVPEKAKAYFVESLLSASRSEYPPRGALIESLQVVDENHLPVNILVKGDHYELRAKVRFTREAIRVRFGWTAKNIAGVVLSGAATHTIGDGFDQWAKDSVLDVTFSFRCLFNPGTYFIDFVVRAEASEPDTIIHGLVDALMFKVQSIPRTHRNGCIDVSVDPVWKVTPVNTSA